MYFLYLLAISTTLGCSVIAFVGAGKQAIEDQKLIEVPAIYSLENKSVAVVIDTDMAILFEHQMVASIIAVAVAGRINENVPNVEVLHPDIVANWQFQTPQWAAMPAIEIAEALKVDRVIYIDLQEYRLNPPGNQELWEGRSAAVIGIIEADGYEQDGFVETFNIDVVFPRRPSVLTRYEASGADIEMGLLNEFIKQTSWLFYFHIEPKHPDRYRPELDS